MNNNYNNIEEGTQGKHFGQLNVKRYLGTKKDLVVLSTKAEVLGEKYIGAIQYIKGEDVWYFTANAQTVKRKVKKDGKTTTMEVVEEGETYRIPEPKDGIESLFDIEFKRQDL